MKTYVLVDQDDCNVFPLPGELVERFFDGGLLGFGVDDEVVFLRVWSFGHMLCIISVFLRALAVQLWLKAYSDTSQQDTRHRILYLVSKRVGCFLVRCSEHEPHLQSPPGIACLCMLTEVTPWLLQAQDVVLVLLEVA